MLRLLIIVGILIGAISFVAYHLFYFKSALSATRSVINVDAKKLIEYLKSVELVPWKGDNLALLSRIGKSNLETELFGEIERGVLYSIYHEPILAFARKTYRANDQVLLLLRINDDYYQLRSIGNRDWKVIKNDDNYGTITHGADISASTSDKQVVIKNSDNTTLVPVLFDSIQKVVIDTDLTLNQTRVLEVIEKMDSTEEELFLIALTYSLIEAQI